MNIFELLQIPTLPNVMHALEACIATIGVLWLTSQIIRRGINSREIVSYNTSRMQELAKEMLDKQLDYSPAADKILPANRALCSYADGAWIVDTHDDVNMKLFTKIECIISLS